MEIQFESATISCWRNVLHKAQNQELTQELKLPEGMPDVGKIVTTRGQLIIRSKQWESDCLSVSGGVMAWVMYLPDTGGALQCLETWLPFQMRWDTESKLPDGQISILPHICSMDARAISSGRMMLRVSISVLLDAMVSDVATIYTLPQNMPEDVQTLQETYPMLIPKDSAEKSFLLEQTLELPASVPGLSKLLSYEATPAVTEQKVVSDKLVVRGNVQLELLYMGVDEQLHSWTFEIPFSQYAQLQDEFGTDAQSVVNALVLSNELVKNEDDALLWKAGIVCQYLVLDRENIELVTDAYSPMRDVKADREGLRLPSVLDMLSERIRLEEVVSAQQIAPIAGNVMLHHPLVQRSDGGADVALKGLVSLVGTDAEGCVTGAAATWNGTHQILADRGCDVLVYAMTPTKVQRSMHADGVLVSADIPMHTLVIASGCVPMVTSVTVGDVKSKDPDRPSLILRRAAGESLWQIAKENGSTIERIKVANGLQQEPEPMQMLLIPVV